MLPRWPRPWLTALGHKRLQSTFQPGDTVLIRSVLRPDKVALSDPLTPGTTWKTQYGQFEHDSLLEKSARSVTVTPKGDKFILTIPTLEDYLLHRRRIAQPIYPLDAAAIVALADVHLDYDPIQIRHFVEAGTGHGSLTLAICKAIHAANPPNLARSAILHSIDRNIQHSRTGKSNVEAFRRGMYARDVEFYVQDSPKEWSETDGSGLEFSGVFLDLPDPMPQIQALGPKLLVDCPLVAFCPSISQIQDLAESLWHDRSLALTMTHVVELMPGMGGSMRSWDVRVTRARETGELARVCRPRVGLRVVGGGFIAVFRKLPDGYRRPDDLTSE